MPNFPQVYKYRQSNSNDISSSIRDTIFSNIGILGWLGVYGEGAETCMNLFPRMVFLSFPIVRDQENPLQPPRGTHLRSSHFLDNSHNAVGGYSNKGGRAPGHKTLKAWDTTRFVRLYTIYEPARIQSK